MDPGNKEKHKNWSNFKIFHHFLSHASVYFRQAYFALNRTPSGGGIHRALLKGRIRWRSRTGQRGAGLKWPTRAFFLLSGQNVSNLALPTSRSELLTGCAIHRFHHIPTETLFREEQRSPGIPGEGWERRSTLKHREIEAMDFRVQSVGSGRLFVWAAFSCHELVRNRPPSSLIQTHTSAALGWKKRCSKTVCRSNTKTFFYHTCFLFFSPNENVYFYLEI